jgi:amino acid permease
MELLNVSKKGFLDPKRIRTGSFYLCAAAMGAGSLLYLLGVLTLPYVLRRSGLILGLLMLILGYSTLYWSFQLIIETDNKTGGNSTMRQLYYSAGGKRLANFYDLTCIFTFFCTLLGNQIISTIT